MAGYVGSKHSGMARRLGMGSGADVEKGAWKGVWEVSVLGVLEGAVFPSLCCSPIVSNKEKKSSLRTGWRATG